MAFTVKLLGERSVRLKIDLGEVLSLGRSPETDLCIDEKLVSRRHCELEGTAEGLVVRDLGSRNGTRLNGARISGEITARPGDQIKVGTSYILVERPRTGTTRTHAQPRGSETAEGAAATVARPRVAGPEIPGYDVLGELAQGNTGKVYRVRPSTGGRQVALKILKEGASETAVKRFLRSAEALRRLDHPNIVRVHDVDAAGDLHFFTMELLEGQTLARMTEKHLLGTREALSIGVQVARALKLVHAEGIIHRDLSPHNIMILHGGVVKLVGFDFVKDVESESETQLTKLGEIVGQLTYSSPEQARDPRVVDLRTDLYALGAVLFHAVTGRPPFTGSRLEAFRKVLSEPPPRLADLVPSVSEHLDAIVDRLLAKEPQDRYQTGEDVERALDDALLESCRADAEDEEAAEDYDGTASGSGETKLPAKAKGLGTRTFGGGFTGFELLEIVQFLELHEKEGRLLISGAGRSGEVFFRRGIIVAATAEDEDGEDAARKLLEAPEGTFEFHALEPGDATLPEGGRQVALQPSSLALDVMRLRDEHARRA